MEKKVRDHKDLYRTPSGAIINKDSSAYENSLLQRKQLEDQRNRINNLEQELLNIKMMISKLTSSNN